MRILFLSTWFPYPLSQGSKIRAYYLLRALAQYHEVALISFADMPIEPAWLAHITQFCQKIEIVQRDPFAQDSLGTILGQLSLQPTSVKATYSQEMASQVQKTVSSWKPQRIVALTFVTAPYAAQIANVPKVVDVDNLMAHMLREAYQQAATTKERMRRWLAWWKFQRYEKWLFSQFDLCLAVSNRDSQTLRSLLTSQSSEIAIVPNGMDLDQNCFGMTAPKPNTLVFNGALTYQANYDGMDYFLREIFPQVRSRVDEVQLQITGKTEGVPISQLLLDDHVAFTGYVKDIRPVVAGSWACVVPLRIGGGTRLKILEAMALGTSVISTSKGAEGLDVIAGKHLLIADTPYEFAAQTVQLLQNPELRTLLIFNARQLMEEKYNWNEIGRQFCDAVEKMTHMPVK